ncbi:hypothetical protein XENTR_v10004888 [Xenopus tropicalis]|uniref:Interferon gamma receptor 2 (interferon gamma transducer 1), gene 2 n=1 Tax=Xenopus tropicalis TaxID=8364 RepID=F6V446_XENTR|nr:interferon gamma receptor 2 isoform X1 [Xenopus tropicalis]KAE8621586.1 hypothetical protein XENTR_v10004888 [Xenopus tropicalis]|eukprot:XP_004912196.1 PREDICTED: interferon gamma receptor 2-like isoform X1 [Xenopus tropicalis]
MATACFRQALLLIHLLPLLSAGTYPHWAAPHTPLAGPGDATSVLPAPTNVSIHSFNLQQILHWDPVKEEDVTYRVEYKAFYEGDDDYSVLCKNTTEMQCNFTDLVPFYWRIVVRVRAEVGKLQYSRWSKTPTFQATRDTTLGPVKSLKLSPSEAVYDAISVTFEPPISREIYLPYDSEINFTVRYWERSSGTEKELSSTDTHVLLEDLDPMAVYCVEVSASVLGLVGQPSEPVCEKPSAAPAITATGYIWLVVGLVCACCAFSVCALAVYKHREMIKKLLPPPFEIPYHFHETLKEISFQRLENDHCEVQSIEEKYDTISIVEPESCHDRKDSCTEELDIKQTPEDKASYRTVT